ncbi:hypothetical protein [Sediminicoccus sp. KRV36]|uniref:hypothetical protein n=1 Tax=Sediminicoccus sp. KRV36 TaxID=3133721 RepID=UPI00200CBDEB|nr:hypothetical protein [Sediminicoccus rosea]UPY36188.1 hypothetical protein LHU95_18510 [Sediminicoccus rosea]
MRMLRLLSMAAQAEGILLRRQSANMGRSAVLGLLAAGFGVTMLALLQLAAWLWLEERQGAIQATLLIALGDGLVALVLLLLARGRTDPVAEEALRLRSQSLSLLTTPSAIRPEWEKLALDVGLLLIERLRRPKP